MSFLTYWETNRAAAIQGLGAMVVIGFAAGIWSVEGSPTWLRGYSAAVMPLVDHYLGTSTRQALQALAVGSACILLLACANVAVLLLVQAIRRRTDLAVRRALGASTAQIVLPASPDSRMFASTAVRSPSRSRRRSSPPSSCPWLRLRSPPGSRSRPR